jgi:eukaryotic-like serine/threonine-protein kinase
MPARRRPRTVAGRYALLERIGQGGSGSVWKAWDRRDKRYVGAKVLESGTCDLEPLLRFVHEQWLRIEDPHVLTPIGWAAEDDVVLLVTELVRGGSLQDLLAAHRRLPESYAVVLLDQLLQALVAVHAHGVVHGDVKPANILLEATGSGRPHLRLADFGVATAAAGGVRFEPGTPVGTPGYLAPEQRRTGAVPHPSQDVYASGVVGRRMLAGPSAVRTLLDSMTRTDPVLRPSAAHSLNRLRALPVGRGGAWPEIPDRLAMSVSRRRLAP